MYLLVNGYTLISAKPLSEPILLIGPLQTNFGDIWIEILRNGWPFCLGLGVLKQSRLNPCAHVVGYNIYQ